MRRMRRVPTRLISDQFRSGLERKVANDLEARNYKFLYEPYKISYTVPAREATYTPDFILNNNIVVETKGYLDADDRHKMLLVKTDHPDLDVRFLFQRDNPIYKGSPTTYSMWCEKHGFPFAFGLVPKAWLDEPIKPLHPCLKPKNSKATRKAA